MYYIIKHRGIDDKISFDNKYYFNISIDNYTRFNYQIMKKLYIYMKNCCICLCVFNNEEGLPHVLNNIKIEIKINNSDNNNINLKRSCWKKKYFRSDVSN